MGRIRVDTGRLYDYVGTLNGRIGEYEAMKSRLVSLNENVKASWKGEAQLAFARMMDTYIQQADQLGQILNQFRDYVKQTADKFEAVDTECAQRIRSSF